MRDHAPEKKSAPLLQRQPEAGGSKPAGTGRADWDSVLLLQQQLGNRHVQRVVARQAETKGKTGDARPDSAEKVRQALLKYGIQANLGEGANAEAAARAVAAVEETEVGQQILNALKRASSRYSFQLRATFVESGTKIEGYSEGGAAGAATPLKKGAGWRVQAHTSHSAGTVVERLADTLFHELLHVWFQEVYTPAAREEGTLDLPYGLETGHSTTALYGFDPKGKIEFKKGEYHEVFQQKLEQFNQQRRKMASFHFNEAE